MALKKKKKLVSKIAMMEMGIVRVWTTAWKINWV